MLRITRWHKSKEVFYTPQLRHNGKNYANSMGKAAILRKVLLRRRTTEFDILYSHGNTICRRSLLSCGTVNELEVKQCLIDMTKTAAGTDGISVIILRVCWESSKEATTLLYQWCLLIGYQPKFFQRAEVVLLTKLQKRDLSSPRSWCPTALLFSLVKGLERLVARCLSVGAIN